MMGTNAYLVIRDQGGAEVNSVPLYSSDAELTNAIAHRIRAGLRAGFWLDYPEGDYQQAARVYFSRGSAAGEA